MERTCNGEKPATSSFGSVNGPFNTVREATEKRTRLPYRAGLERLSCEQDSGLYQRVVEPPHAADNSFVGITPASLSRVAFTRSATFIGDLRFSSGSRNRQAERTSVCTPIPLRIPARTSDETA